MDIRISKATANQDGSLTVSANGTVPVLVISGADLIAAAEAAWDRDEAREVTEPTLTQNWNRTVLQMALRSLSETLSVVPKSSEAQVTAEQARIAAIAAGARTMSNDIP